MKLSLPFLEKKENISYFLVLVLRNQKANAVIFEETLGKAKVISQHEEYFENSIEDASDEELLNTVDKTISTAESSLPQNIETQKTVFGVKENWVENGRIKKEYLAKLKRISDELGLVPIGFLITTEAIAHFLAKQEGAPISAILIENDKNYISVALVRAGKIIEIKNAQGDGSVAATVDTILKHFESAEILPSRIVIFNGEEDLTQDFISHSWSKSLPFLHLPQITNLPSGFDAQAVLFGAATEMGFEVLRTEEIKPTIEQAELGVIEQEKNQKAQDEENIQEETQTLKQDSSMEYFGFVKDKDIAKIETPKVKPQEVPPSVIEQELKEIPEDLQIQESESQPFSANAAMIFEGAKNVLSKIKLPPLPKGNKIIILPAGVLLLFIFLFIFYLFAAKAMVTLEVDAKSVSQDKDVTFSTSGQTDPSKNIIAAQFIEVSESGSTTTNATGKKDIGTKAKGKVTVFNNSDSSRTLSSGTTITSSNSLQFTLDNSVTIASASGDVFSGTTPGKADVAVTASEIGTEYNLPSNTKFTISNTSSIAAKNDNPFSGGTKKQITVVSKDDIAKLETDLPKSLEGKAKDDIGKKISAEKSLLPVFVDETLGKKDFSKDAGDETSTVTLKAEVSYKSIVYNKSDLKSYALETLKSSGTENLTLDKDKISANVKEIKKKESTKVDTTLEILGFLIPKIEESKLSKEISGKSFSNATKILKEIPQVSNVKISLSPSVPLFPKSLPRSSKNINFKVLVNE